MRTSARLLASLTSTVPLALAAPAAAQGLEDPIPAPIPESPGVISLETVATGLTAPNLGVAAPEDPDHLYVADQVGLLWRIELATGDKEVFLDVSDRLVDLGVGGPGTFDERGLLGVAFHPLYARTGLFYTYTSEPVDGPADFTTLPAGIEPNHQSVIAEWQVLNPLAADPIVDLGSRRELLRVDQPQFNHDAGMLAFRGDEPLLYIAFGDGGAADDQGDGHGPTGNGQNPGTILGTIARIDPLGSNGANGQYGVPPSNPFTFGGQELPEVFAYGLRNPFRFSFDRLTGALLCADVGQNDIEEVNVVNKGRNYGWNFKEGTFFFDPNGDEDGFVTDRDPGFPPNDELIDPIAQYDHDEGTAIIGGYVYRGSAIPQLDGIYVFGDHAHEGAGRLFHLEGGMSRFQRIFEFQIQGGALDRPLLGIGEDAAGELYVLVNDTGVPFGDSGEVLRIAPAR